MMTHYRRSGESGRCRQLNDGSGDNAREQVRVLAEGVAHNLGTALSVVMGRADMIERGEIPFDEVEKSAAIIKERSETMRRVINDLLLFGRISESEREMVALENVVDGATKLIRPHAESSGVELTVHSPSSRTVEVHGDADQLTRALTNIMDNGIDAMPDGGNLLASIEHHSTLRQEDSQDGTDSFHVIRIADHGVGIEVEDIAKVFLPFYTTKPVGVGLGLSIACAVIDDHGGWISVASEPGEGTEFRVHLPVEVGK